MLDKQNAKKPRLTQKARLVLSAVFNSFCILTFGGFGTFGLFSDAVPGALFCLSLSAFFICLFVWSVKLIGRNALVCSGKGRVLRITAAAAAWFTAFFLLSQLAATVIIYEFKFNDHFETYAPYMLSVSDFDALESEKRPFMSDKGQMLAGYKYYKADLTEPKGVAIISHGFGGGGQNGYMAVANRFAESGYAVFAYDATGNDLSEGSSTGGLPQGCIDLDCAINYVEASEDMKDLPVVLFGHSWGAYSVTSVLNLHPEVKAVVSVSGFNRSSDLLESYAVKYAGSVVKLTMPFVNAYERIKFGKYASFSAVEGFERSDAGVFVIHSADDDAVLPQYGYDRYYEKFKDDDRFVFVGYEDRGHGKVFYSDAARDYADRFEADTKKMFNDGKDGKDAYVTEHLSKSLFYELDDELFDKIIKFYDANINR